MTTARRSRSCTSRTRCSGTDVGCGSWVHGFTNSPIHQIRPSFPPDLSYPLTHIPPTLQEIGLVAHSREAGMFEAFRLRRVRVLAVVCFAAGVAGSVAAQA